MSSFPGLGRAPGGGHGNPLQYSCLENPMDSGTRCVTVHAWGYKDSDSTEATENNTQYALSVANPSLWNRDPFPIINTRMLVWYLTLSLLLYFFVLHESFYEQRNMVRLCPNKRKTKCFSSLYLFTVIYFLHSALHPNPPNFYIFINFNCFTSYFLLNPLQSNLCV